MPTISLMELVGRSVDGYNKEENRIASFSAYHGPISTLRWTRDGFFYNETENKIECFDCRQSISVVRLQYERNSAETQESYHLTTCSKFLNNVPLYSRSTIDLQGEHALRFIRKRAKEIKSRRTSNLVPLTPIDAKTIDSVIYYEPGSLEMAPTDNCPCDECVNITDIPCCLYIKDSNGISFTRCGLAICARRHLEHTDEVPNNYHQLHNRISTYTTIQGWEGRDFPTPAMLAEAGFIFTGIIDNVKCFKCEGSLQNWDQSADPWREHARWFPWCPFLRQEIGDIFIHDVLQTTKEIRESHEERPQLMEFSVLNDALREGYSKELISKAIQDFFAETGSYPGHEALRKRLVE